ncbi:class I SAM-dependent methyltransferase [Bradyrhizobium sp. 2TAF24]|uniref:class I SAM-dependent methyltransferase n=1 Tax=Bradyrhizobium sp. 2TAF24 TaxID=3233011 RepID=UPI003F8ECEC5
MTDQRIRAPVLAERRFAARRDEFAGLDLAERFALIHRTNLWGAAQSTSGVGSELDATARLRHELPVLLHSLGIRTLLDLPCGDFGWMSNTTLGDIRYLGADIVPAIIAANTAAYGQLGRVDFITRDLVTDDLPAADLILCRDCLVHLSFDNIGRAIANMQRSGARWLLATTFVELTANRDIEDGDWRALNFTQAPFHFPPPEAVLVEGCTEAGGDYADKALGLWQLAKLPAIITAHGATMS